MNSRERVLNVLKQKVHKRFRGNDRKDHRIQRIILNVSTMIDFIDSVLLLIFNRQRVRINQIWDVTSLLKDGDNEITVKVIGSLKNTFGYFFKEADKWIYGPHEWNYAPEKAPDASGYFLMDYGMMEPFGLVQVK